MNTCLVTLRYVMYTRQIEYHTMFLLNRNEFGFVAFEMSQRIKMESAQILEFSCLLYY